MLKKGWTRLKYDFGAKDILLAFSGNRGFHIYVRDENIMQLNGNERKILLEYILGSGFDYEMLFNINGQKIVGPKPTESGYRGRFARKTIEMIKNNKAFAKNFGRDENEINDFLDGIENGLWSKTRKRNIIEKLKPVSDAITIKESFIDPPVTYDLSKLMRVVNSLHGSTGFRVLPIKDIDAFNIQDAYAFSDEKIEIVASDDIEPNKVIDLKEKIKKGGILKVPLYAAIFLVCQKKAIIKI
ncbi:MAG: DNA primase small subunit domain-containing protein [Candidatus Anstonellales archaeon]